MARATPRVVDTTLFDPANAAQPITVGTPPWYAWLQAATTFAFTDSSGRFTARKERRGPADGYWRAYRKHAGLVRSAYLGRTADLTLERLQAVAATLAQLSPSRDAPMPSTAGLIAPAAVRTEQTPRLPEGTVTFLFTDIEGSTQLWQQHPQAMPQALARHDAILREAIATHGGVVFKTVGDGVHAVFVSALAALAAALAVQHALRSEQWQATGVLRVRMVLHSGVAEVRNGDYFGPTLNRLARLLAVAHAGQILLSQATAALLGDALPAGTSLRDLGSHALKDLPQPEPIFQLVTVDLPSEFPPLRSLSGRPPATPTLPPHLLATKLYAPPARPDLVARPRLFERLTAGLSGKLTLVAAPAGFGKTTLVSAWLAEMQKATGKRQNEDGDSGETLPFTFGLLPFNVAWVSLDARDNQPTRFWSYVSAALNTLAPGSGDAALALLQAPQPPPLEAIVTTLLNALSAALPHERAGKVAVLVLDDYHTIEAPAIHRALATLLEHLPPQLHLLLATRADPPLPLARLRAGRQLTELRAAELRFSLEEASIFLTEVMGLPLSEADVAMLEARTEGWIAGLQLAALAMRDRSDLAGFIGSFTGSNRFVMHYLAEEVFARQPSHIQTFLLRTAMLDRMCGPLCDAILGLIPDQRPGANDHGRTSARASVANGEQQPAPVRVGPRSESYSQLILEQLERANLFLVPLDDERLWYRYHHLFADVLRARLRSGTTPATVAGLHRRASAWYEAVGLIDEAIRHALSAPDVEAAATLVERYATALWLERGEVPLARSWVEQLPDALVAARPRLTLAAGWTLAFTFQSDAAEQLLAKAATTLSAPDLPPEVIGELTVLRSVIAHVRDDLAETLALSLRALEQLPAVEQTWRAVAALNCGWAYVRLREIAAAIPALMEASTLAAADGRDWIALAAFEELATLQARQGQLTQCLRTCERAVELVRGRGQRPNLGAGMAYVGIGEVLYERNDLDGAAHALMHCIELLRQTTERGLVVRGYAALARVKQARGDGARALATIQCAEEWFAQMQLPGSVFLTWLAAQRARLWIRQGNLLAAEQWASAPAVVEDREVEAVEQLTLVRLYLAQHQRDPDGRFTAKAAERLAQLRATAEASGWIGDLIEILALQALTQQALGDRAGALAALAHALTLAEPQGYIRIFVDEGAPMAKLLREAIAHGIAPNYISKLLAAFPRIEVAETRHSVLSPQFSTLVEPLSERELEILQLIALGLSNQAIAERLVIALSTVKRHINNLYGKLAVQSRTQALVRARELNLL